MSEPACAAHEYGCWFIRFFAQNLHPCQLPNIESHFDMEQCVYALFLIRRCKFEEMKWCNLIKVKGGFCCYSWKSSTRTIFGACNTKWRLESSADALKICRVSNPYVTFGPRSSAQEQPLSSFPNFPLRVSLSRPHSHTHIYLLDIRSCIL
jgi:hypothetical protein